jgi:hypothetical protein
MNPTHQLYVKRLNDLLIQAPNLNAIPYLTSLSGQFEADENAAAFGSPDLLHLVDQIGQAIQIAGTMAAENLQEAETRRAQSAGEVAIQYPAFTWVYTAAGTLSDRLNAILQAPFALDRATNQAPPAPPTPSPTEPTA